MATIGISSSCFYPINTEIALKTALEAGITHFEIHFSTFSELSDGYIKEIRKMLRHYGAQVHSLHPFYSLLESPMFFSDYSERRFADALELYKQFFHTAARLDAQYVILHGGQTTGKNRVIISQDEYIERYNTIFETARKHGVTLLHENVYMHVAQTTEFCRRLIEYLGDKALFAFDNKQARRAGSDSAAFAEAISGHIRVVHISDCDREHDCLLPGKGNEDFPAIRHAMSGDDKDAFWAIEVYNNAFTDPEQIVMSLKYLSMKLGEAEQSKFTKS